MSDCRWAESRSLRHNGEQYKAKAVSHLDRNYETSDPYYCVGPPFSLPPLGRPRALLPLPHKTTLPFVFTRRSLRCRRAQFLTSLPRRRRSPPTLRNSPGQARRPTTPARPRQCRAHRKPSPTRGHPVYEANPPTIFSSPTGFLPSPPPPHPPPSYVVPGTLGFVPSPPPPSYVFPSPLGFAPSPPEFVPGPPIFLPPVVYPSPGASPQPPVS